MYNYDKEFPFILRWHQTYDSNGVNSEITLQYSQGAESPYDKEATWEDIPFIRERDV